MNHAGMSLMPVSPELELMIEDRSRMAPPDLYEKSSLVTPRVRELYSRMLNVESEEIAITQHTAEGVNFVAQGYPWKKGDRILTVSVEYPSNVYPWWNIRDRGVEIVTFPEQNGRVVQERFIEKIDESITMVVISHVEFASGFTFDLPRLARVCRERSVFLFVDIAQSIGVLPVDLSMVDAAAWPTWKWLLGPVGMGGFYLARRNFERIRPVLVGCDGMVKTSDYLEYRFEFLPSAARFEYSTANQLGVLGTLVALERLEGVCDFGETMVREEVYRNCDEIIAGMTKLGFRLFTSMEHGERSGIISFVAPKDPSAIAAALRKEKVDIACRAGRIRVSPHFYNNSDDIGRLLAAMKRVLAGVS